MALLNRHVLEAAAFLVKKKKKKTFPTLKHAVHTLTHRYRAQVSTEMYSPGDTSSSNVV